MVQIQLRIINVVSTESAAWRQGVCQHLARGLRVLAPARYLSRFPGLWAPATPAPHGLLRLVLA